MRTNAVKIIIGSLIIFGIIYAYTREVAYFQNTLDLKKLLLYGVAAGAILGAALGYYFGRNRRELLERFQIFMGALLISILLMPLFTSLSNRLFAERTTEPEQLELLRVETYAGSRFGLQKELQENPDGYRAFVLRDGEVLRLQKKELPFPGREKGDLVPVNIRRGLWGIEFVDW